MIDNWHMVSSVSAIVRFNLISPCFI